ncbi:hypothetical protein VTN00DRAFT_4871 [Thermoascus crustaceus]
MEDFMRLLASKIYLLEKWDASSSESVTARATSFSAPMQRWALMAAG